MSGDVPSSDVGIREGEILAGKYRVSRVIGSGGMGVVVVAHHIHLDEKVAIKVLHPNVLGIAEAVDRFVREARSAAKIKSEHVVRVSDVDRLPNGAPYMVMEYLEGLDLGAWMAQRGPLEVEQAVEFVLQTCEAVADAHALGIIHRDLKPSNLFCVRRNDGRPFVKILDFGISKAIGTDTVSSGPGITGTHAMLGSPLYMSPEQMRASRDVDARTDIWSLGVILYELLAGKVPFNGSGIPEVCVRVSTEAAVPLGAYRTDIPLALENVVTRCLNKDRSARYANVAELAMALAPFGPRGSRDSAERIARVLHQAGLSGTALTSPPASEQPNSRETGDTMAGLGVTTPGSKRRRLVALAIVVSLAVVAVAMGVAIFAGRSQRASPPPIAVATELSTNSDVSPRLPVLPAPSDSSHPDNARVNAPTPVAVKAQPGPRAPGAKRESTNEPIAARNSQSPTQPSGSRGASSAQRPVATNNYPNNLGG